MIWPLATHPFDRRAGAARHAEVGQFDLAALAVKDEDVLGLDVTVHQLLTVKVVQGDGNLVHTALSNRLRETHLDGEGRRLWNNINLKDVCNDNHYKRAYEAFFTGTLQAMWHKQCDIRNVT